MSVCLLVRTDGRDDLLAQTIDSAMTHLRGPITRWVLHDDTGSIGHATKLAARYPLFEVSLSARAGFGGALKAAWESVGGGDEDWCFDLEDDFLFERTVYLEALMEVMVTHPYLAQMALRRQAWNEAEKMAGGVVEQDPQAFTDRSDGVHAWLEHRRFWTTNPSLVPMSRIRQGWPDEARSEGIFTHRLLEDQALRFGYWGARDSGVWVHHIGLQRAGSGY